MKRLTTHTDFEAREELVFPTPNGRYVVSYANGYPVGRFEGDPKAPR